MKTQNTAQEDEYEFFYGHHVVAFLDLLGQKDRLCEIEGALEGTDPEAHREKLQQTLKHTVGTIWAFRKQFLDFFNGYLQHQPSIPIPKEIENYFSQVRGHSQIKFQSFSDSTIVWTPVHLETDFAYAQVLNSIHGILTSVGLITPLFLSKKIPFRGGIDLEGGILISPNGNEIYGPVLNRAYSLESKDADYPRVLIGRGLIDFLNHASSIRLQDENIQRYCQTMAERCNAWIVVDDDQKPMVHFLGPSNRELVATIPEGPNYFRDILEPMRLFIHECEAKFENNEKLGERYWRLRVYFDKYIGEWKS